MVLFCETSINNRNWGMEYEFPTWCYLFYFQFYSWSHWFTFSGNISSLCIVRTVTTTPTNSQGTSPYPSRTLCNVHELHGSGRNSVFSCTAGKLCEWVNCSWIVVHLPSQCPNLQPSVIESEVPEGNEMRITLITITLQKTEELAYY